MRAIDADGLKAELIVLSIAGKPIDIVAVIDAQPTIQQERIAKKIKSIGGVQFCEACHFMIYSDSKFCQDCGAKFQVTK